MREHATGAQRIGNLLAIVEAAMLGLLAALHFGLDWALDKVSIGAVFTYPLGIVEGLLALALLLAVMMPGAGAVRAGRVMTAQILTVIGLFVGEIVLMRGASTLQAELYDGAVLVVALASIALIASPAFRRPTVELRPTVDHRPAVEHRT